MNSLANPSGSAAEKKSATEPSAPGSSIHGGLCPSWSGNSSAGTWPRCAALCSSRKRRFSHWTGRTRISNHLAPSRRLSAELLVDAGTRRCLTRLLARSAPCRASSMCECASTLPFLGRLGDGLPGTGARRVQVSRNASAQNWRPLATTRPRLPTRPVHNKQGDNTPNGQ